MLAKIIIISAFAAVLSLIAAETSSDERRVATASFVPPQHCIKEPELARALGVVQACVQRFSPTHEFTIILSEYRLRTSRKDVVSNAEIASMAVDEHIVKLIEANESQPGITLAAGEPFETPEPAKYGADHCSTIWSVAEDRRVPGYEGEEFRIWAQTFVCARADSSDNSIQVVELRSSERFRVKTDDFRDRFEFLEPAISALEADASLKMY